MTDNIEKTAPSATAKKVAVNSSTIKSISYNQDARVLDVEFLNGTVSHHTHITQDTYLRFLATSSYTTFYNDFIKSKI